MESQKSPLFNIVTSVLQQPLELMWTRRTSRICIFLLYKQGGIVSPYLTQTRFKTSATQFWRDHVKQILLLPAKCSDMLVDTIGDSVLFCSITPCLSTVCSRSLCAPFYYENTVDGWMDIYCDGCFLPLIFSLKQAQCVTRLSRLYAYIC